MNPVSTYAKIEIIIVNRREKEMNKPTIYITRKIPQELLDPYEEILHVKMWDKEEVPIPKEVLIEEIKEADGLLCLITENIDAEVLQHAKHLKVIANMAVGYDNIDVKAANEKGIMVTNTPDVLTETTADLAFTLLLTTARRIIEANQTINHDKWGDWAPFMLAGTDVHHKKIAIVGMGRIGESVGRRAKGFGMEILYHNRSRNEQIEQELGARYGTFEEVISEADFIVSLVPFTEATADIFNEVAFAKMKSHAIFINASRGGVVDEQALYNALKNGVIQAAGLDVFKNEPIDSTHPLASLPNAVLLPHIGSASIQTREKMIQLCLQNISNVFTGKDPLTEVK